MNFLADLEPDDFADLDEFETEADRVLDELDLVLFTATEEWADGEPATEALDDLGLVSWGLWARWEDKGIEIPLIAEHSWHQWYSVSPDTFEPDAAEPISDELVAGIDSMDSYDDDNVWGGIEIEIWDEMTELEQYITHLVREGFTDFDGLDEPRMIAEWCHRRDATSGDDS